MDGKRITVVMTCLTTPQKVKKRVITLDSSAASDPSIEEINVPGDGGEKEKEKEKEKQKKKKEEKKGTPHPSKVDKAKATDPKVKDTKTGKLSQTKLNFSSTPGRVVGAKAPREETSGSEAGSPGDKKSPTQKRVKKKSKGAQSHHKF